MDKLMKRHSEIKTDVYGNLHANITAKVSIGFAEWLCNDYVGLQNPNRWRHDTDSRKSGTTQELFNLYLTTLK